MTGRRHMSQKREKGDLTLMTLNDNCGICINVGRKLPTCYSFLFVCLQERQRNLPFACSFLKWPEWQGLGQSNSRNLKSHPHLHVAVRTQALETSSTAFPAALAGRLISGRAWTRTPNWNTGIASDSLACSTTMQPFYLWHQRKHSFNTSDFSEEIKFCKTCLPSGW